MNQPVHYREVEIKFTCIREEQTRICATLADGSSAEVLEEIRGFFKYALFAVVPLPRHHIVDVYFDTPDRGLLRKQVSVRIRERNGGVALSVKLFRSQEEGEFVRDEMSRDLTAEEAKRFRLEPQSFGLSISDIDTGTLKPVLVIDNDRRDFEVRRGTEAYVVSVDRFTFTDLETNTRSPPQLEVEVEAANEHSKLSIRNLRKYLIPCVKGFQASTGSKYESAMRSCALERHREAFRLRNRFVIVFLHGFWGDPERTWRSMKTLIREDAELSGRSEVYCFRYPAAPWRVPFVSVKRSGVDDLSLALHAQLRNMFVGRDIVLVAHSLGGLVARRYVLDHIEEGDAFRVKRLLLYAVPNDGSELARLGGLFSPGNRQLRHCCKDGDFIRYLNDDWNRKQVMSRLPVRYVVAAGDRVVSPDSAGRSLGLDRVDLLAEKNHRSVVEPVNREDLSYLILRSFVLGEGR